MRSTNINSHTKHLIANLTSHLKCLQGQHLVALTVLEAQYIAREITLFTNAINAQQALL